MPGKALIGHCKKANTLPARFIREYRTEEPIQFGVGDKITVKESARSVHGCIGTGKGKGLRSRAAY